MRTPYQRLRDAPRIAHSRHAAQGLRGGHRQTSHAAHPGFQRLRRVIGHLFACLLLIGITTPALATDLFPAGAPWFNVSRPLTNADLAGRVVLLDFFTPGCINCIHMLPETKRLEHEFGNRLLIIGVNSPKFTASQQSSNIKGFIARYHITHPIVTDKGMTLWKLFSVYAWPTQILLGPNLMPVARFVGEGHYAQIREAVIKTLAKARAAGDLTHAALPLKPPPVDPHGLLQPGKVAVSGSYVAVSDTGHNRILLLNRDGKLLHIIGTGKPGAVNGAADAARFDSPQGLAFVGRSLYVADAGNQLIRRIDLPSGAVTTVAGNGHQAYGVVGMHAARSVGLNSPWALEAVGNTLYIAMAGDHQVWRYDLKQGRIGPYAGSGYEGLSNGALARAKFAQSSGLAYHDGILYVADPESSSVRAIIIAQNRVRTVLGFGLFDFGLRDGPSPQALLQHDQGLAWLNGKLYIADTFNNAIRVYEPGSQQLTTLTTALAQPGGLAAFGPHTLLVADTNANRMVTIDTENGAVQDWPIKGSGF